MQGLQLLILSACESAAADLKGAVDEVRSISTAMLQAGAHAVLAPLWKVNDHATFLLMARFAQEWFPRIKKESPAAALARAQRWLRNVTNEELSSWEASALPQEKEQQETTMHMNTWQQNYGSEANSTSDRQRLRAEMHDAEGLIRQEASTNQPDLRPYADPIYWAGFQIVGW